MLKCRCQAEVESTLARQAAVALLGPRQAGKTTLALMVAETRPSIYLDLESAQDRAKLSDAELYFAQHADELIILDEIHRAPDIFQTLRGVIDRARRRGKRTGLFLLLGSAAIDLLRQSGETLAGRIEYVNMGPLDALEIGVQARPRTRGQRCAESSECRQCVSSRAPLQKDLAARTPYCRGLPRKLDGPYVERAI